MAKLAALNTDLKLRNLVDREAPLDMLVAVGLVALTQMLLAKLSLSGLYCCGENWHTDMITSISTTRY